MKYSLIYFFITLIFGLGLNTTVKAQVFFGDSLDQKLQVSQPVYFIDDTGSKRFEDVVENPFRESREAAINGIKKLNKRRVIWIKLSLTTNEKIGDTLALRIPRFTEATIYTKKIDRVDSVAVSLRYQQFLSAYGQRPYVAILPIFQSGDTLDIYCKIKNYSRIHFIDEDWFYFATLETMDTEDPDEVDETTQGAYIYIFFCGFLLFQIAYVLLQWYMVRRRVYANYAGYILCVFLYYYARFSVFINQVPSLSYIDFNTLLLINNTLLILPSYFYFRFSRLFVDMKSSDPQLNTLLKRYEYFLLFAIAVELLLRHVPNDLPKSIPLIVVLISQLPVAIYAFYRLARQRRSLAYFLIAGSSIALLSHVVANFMPVLFNWMLAYISPPSVTMMGILIEVGIFNTGLLFKARESEVQKLAAQDAFIFETKSRQALQEQFSTVRNKLASDLHDDIGSSLSSIRIYSYAAKQKLQEEESDQTALLLSNIERSSEAMMNNMSDMVWAMNPENDSNERLIERLKSFGFEILAACDAVFEVEISPAFLNLSLDQAQRKNLLLIFKEAINNAAKYSGASKVLLRIESLPSGAFEFLLRDNGRGLPTTTTNGNGMRTMRERCEELKTTLTIDSGSEGTRVAFRIKW